MGKMKDKYMTSKLEEALWRVLEAGTLEVAKEFAAEVLEVDVEDYLVEDCDDEVDMDDFDWYDTDQDNY